MLIDNVAHSGWFTGANSIDCFVVAFSGWFGDAADTNLGLYVGRTDMFGGMFD